MELPGNIEELLKIRIGIHKALLANVDLNAGKPEMASTEQSLLKNREAVDAKLAELGYIKPNLPKCSCIKERKPCYIKADLCNYSRIERLSIGCIILPGEEPEQQPVNQEAAPAKKKRKRRKRESKSRAARASRAADGLSSLAEELKDSAETLKGLASELDEVMSNEVSQEDADVIEHDGPEESEKARDPDEIRSDIQEEVDRISKAYEENFLTDEIQNLADEMRNWSDGLEGTNLANSDKAQTIADTADTLEQTVNTLDSLSLPDFDGTDVQSFADELEQLAGDIEDASSDVSSCDFPGMYG